jgi:hypothetical protein
MTHQTNRTDPCPCKSGKLFKECHMRVYKPTEEFSVKANSGVIAPDYHMEKKEGSEEWVKVPGALFVMLGFQEKNYDDIDNMLKDISMCIPENRRVLRERITRLKHKLYGIRYHIENFKHEEDKIIEKYHENYHAPGTHSFYHNPRLIYEIEAFLFQIKSALDILAQIIAMTFNLNGLNTYSVSDKGNKIVKKLREIKRNEVLRIELANTLERSDKWVRDAIDMRDEVTHISDLQGFMCFVQKAWDGGEFARISYPSMPDGQRASSYMLDTYGRLYQLLFDVSPYLITKWKIEKK